MLGGDVMCYEKRQSQSKDLPTRQTSTNGRERCVVGVLEGDRGVLEDDRGVLEDGRVC